MINKNLKTILIIDDEKDILELATDYFRNQYNIIVASSYSEAIFKYNNQEFDVIISDMKLPNKDGIDILRELKRITVTQKRPQPKIIVITGNIEDYTERLENVKYSAIIEKPFKLSEMGYVIKNLLSKKDQEAEKRESLRPTQVKINRGEVLIKVSEMPDGLFRVCDGQLGVYTPDSELIAQIEMGGVIGEMSSLEKMPSEVYIRAHTDCVLLHISEKLLDQTLATQPVWLRELFVGLSSKLRHTTRKLAV